jgi:adenylate kinase
MTRPIIVIVDAQTNETIEREMNDAEFAEYQESINRQNELVAAREQATAEAAAKKAAAEAKLVALGLDLDDIKALGL